MGRTSRRTISMLIVTFAIGLIASVSPAVAQLGAPHIDDALQNITNLFRADRVGYATFWDKNKFVQCRRMPARELRCEAAGTAMQPSLRNVLTVERLNRLASLGWSLDPAFGNYVSTFPSEQPTMIIAEQIQKVLVDGYDANIAALEISTRWVADVPCPPRVGRSQNLAGSVNDLPSMSGVVLRSCSYTTSATTTQVASSPAELIALHGATVTAEVQRLRINATRRVWFILDTGIGYVQCSPNSATAVIYCEGQSVESWPALAAVLTPERVSILRGMGYADPGKAPNYSKDYPQKAYADSSIAAELLTVLFKVYGYNGAGKLQIKTERPG